MISKNVLYAMAGATLAFLGAVPQAVDAAESFRSILVLPVLFEGEVKAVVELASFQRFNTNHLTFLDQLTESIGIVLNTIAANMRTEDLLMQSQSLAQELQSRQQELQQTNEELQEKARLLVHQQGNRAVRAVLDRWREAGEPQDTDGEYGKPSHDKVGRGKGSA